MMVMVNFLTASAITVILMMTFNSINNPINLNYSKLDNFECGFNQMSINRLPFSSQFFMLSILFLIFDLEISVMLPFILLEVSEFYIYSIMMLFILVLATGLLIEWKQGMLEWSK